MEKNYDLNNFTPNDRSDSKLNYSVARKLMNKKN